MQTAEAETATPDQLRRGATLIVTFPLWPLHFPSIPAFNPSGGGGSRSPKTKRHRRTTRRKKKRKGKRKKKSPIQNTLRPSDPPPSQTLAPPLPTTNPPRDSPDAPARRGLGPCGSPAVVGWESARRRPAERRGGGGRWSRAWATSTASGGSSGAARLGRSTSVRAAAPRLVGGFPFFWFFFWWIVFSSGVAESVGCGFAPAGTNVQTNEEVAIKLVSWCDNTHVFAYSTIFLSLFFLGGGGRRGSQLVDWGGSDG